MSSDTIFCPAHTNKSTGDCHPMDETMEMPIDEAVDKASAEKNKRDFLNQLARASTLALRNMHSVAVEHANATTVVDSFGFVVPSEVMMTVKERLRKNLEAQGIVTAIKQASTVPTPVKKIRKKRVSKKLQAVNTQETPIKQRAVNKKRAAHVGVSSNKTDNSVPHPLVLNGENQTSVTTQETDEYTGHETAEYTDHETTEYETPQNHNCTKTLDELHADVQKAASYTCSSDDFVLYDLDLNFDDDDPALNPMNGWED